ncbi:FecCD family ABC transporter permease [Zavarzinia compransoris]|uniref:Iron ABC transporter permease n=1 Tax=Zavarzinia compransoris TaxID=1264899 RepID=A0A317E2V9_9PROT|nr:iron ABC transporter permease [Zavarzinia compransoris]PWR20486.1 iron ABC transporter permease [Zavarzinia compransoris]TDP43869.1 iron complex transport system permease protein [Zavarzinia compransoris]
MRALPWSLVPVILLVLAAGALAFGAYPVVPGEMLQWLWWRLGDGPPPPPAVVSVIEGIRGPRIAAALLIGAGLSLAGAAYQSLFRNPLVSPDLLGVSAGAALGAVLGIFLSLPAAGIQGLSFAGGLVAVGLVYLLARAVAARDPLLVLVLAGIVIGTLFGAGLSILKVLADPYNQLPAITFWLLGSLAGIRADEVLLLLPAALAGMAVLLVLHWRIDVMTLGEDEARALGVATGRLRLAVIAAATLLTAAAVAFSGIIGWVGLVVPHLARLAVGPRFARLGPASAAIGAGFLLAVDTLARSAADVEIPLGILTALVGTPIFVWLLAARSAEA